MPHSTICHKYVVWLAHQSTFALFRFFKTCRCEEMLEESLRQRRMYCIFSTHVDTYGISPPILLFFLLICWATCALSITSFYLSHPPPMSHVLTRRSKRGSCISANSLQTKFKVYCQTFCLFGAKFATAFVEMVDLWFIRLSFSWHNTSSYVAVLRGDLPSLLPDT